MTPASPPRNTPRWQPPSGMHLMLITCLFVMAAAWAPLALRALVNEACDPGTQFGWAACRVGW